MNAIANDYRNPGVMDAIRAGFTQASNQMHARSSVKALVASMGQYFAYVSYNSMISLNDVSGRTVGKAIMATDFQPVPEMEAWSLHKTDIKEVIKALQGGTDHDEDFRIIVGYMGLEDGLAKHLEDMDTFTTGNEATIRDLNELINLQAGENHLYQTGGHIPAARAVSLLELVRVYLGSLNLSEEPGGVKLSSSITGGDIEGRKDVSDVVIMVEDMANNLFIEISIHGLK